MSKTTNRWPLHQSFFWQEMPFFRVLIPFICGIILYDLNWLKLPAGLALIVIVIAAAVFTTVSIIKRRNLSLNYISFISLQIFIAGFSFYCCLQNDDRSKNTWFGQAVNKYEGYEVKILEAPQIKAKTVRLKIHVLEGIKGNKVENLCGTAFLSVYKNDFISANYTPGDTLLVPANWTAIVNSGNPFEYDYKTACRRNNIYFQQLAASDELLMIGKGRPEDLSWLQRFHNWSDAQLQHYLTSHSAYGLLQAMLLGDEQNFDPELRQAYSDTGIIHIVSISGSHVAVLFWVVTTLLFWLKGPKANWLKYALGVLFVWIYVLMAGAPPSALRSAIMFTIIAIGIVGNKEGNSINTLMAAAFVILCINPVWLFSVGFQLSFGAVLSIMLFYQPIYRLWPQTKWLSKAIWQAIAASIAAEILTAPLVIYYFHNFPVFFLVANLAALCIIGFCALIGGMLIIAFSWFPLLAKGLATVTTWMIFAFNWFIVLLQGCNPQSFKFLYLSPLMLLVVYLTIIFLAIFFLKKIKVSLFIGMGFACLLFFIFIGKKWQSLHQERFVVYNANHENLIEKTMGLQYSLLSGDDSNTQNYIAKPGHIAWNAWHLSKEKDSYDCFLLHNKKVLLLRNYCAGTDSSHFNVDVLVVLQPLKGLSVANLKQKFQPKVIVAGNDQRHWLLAAWKDSCKMQNMLFHATMLDGAFLLE